MAAGFLDEVRALRARGLSPDAPALRAVGYREMRACLEGRLDAAAALAATVLATRQFAKRQRTWFRREPGVRWRHPEADARPRDERDRALPGRGLTSISDQLSSGRASSALGSGHGDQAVRGALVQVATRVPSSLLAAVKIGASSTGSA